MKVGLGGKDVVQTLESEGAILLLINTRWRFNVRDCVSLQVQDDCSKKRSLDEDTGLQRMDGKRPMKVTKPGLKHGPERCNRDAGLRLGVSCASVYGDN